MAIVSVLMVIAVPRFSHMVDYIKLKKDAEELSHEIRLARHRAIATREPNQVRFYSEYGYYRVYQPEISNRYLSDGIKFASVSFPRNSRGWVMCQFNALGTPALGGTVALKNRRGQKLYVIVNPVAGRVRVSTNPPTS